VELRGGVPGDAAAVADVHVRSWKAAFPGLVPQGYLDALRPEDRFDQWHGALSSSPWPVVLVGHEEGRIVGFVSVAPSADTDADPGAVGEVQMLYVDPAAQGCGNGALLLEAGVTRLAEAGFARAGLWVLHSNTRARRFYERHGWAPDGVAKEHDWLAFVATDVRYTRLLP
jgi:ribosomal protein S18 acetylase RimI-like enzyme